MIKQLSDDAEYVNSYLDEMGWVMRRDDTCHTYAWLKQIVRRRAQAAHDNAVRQMVKLLPQIPERLDHNKTCFDCVERIKQELKKLAEGKNGE